MNTVRTTVNLDKELIKRAKQRALDEGTTLTNLIDRGLRLMVREAGAKPYVPSELLPAFGAGGQLIDLEDTASREQLEEEWQPWSSSM